LFSKSKKILHISSPIETRVLKILDFQDDAEIKLFYPESQLTGYTEFSLSKRYENYEFSSNRPIHLQTNSKINYGNNIIVYSGTGSHHNWVNKNFSISRLLPYLRSNITLGDLGSQSSSFTDLTTLNNEDTNSNLSNSLADTQSSTWGFNLNYKSQSNDNKISHSSDFSIFLPQEALISIIINEKPFSAYTLDPGNHLLKDIPKFSGMNTVKILATYTDTKKEELLLEETFFHNLTQTPVGSWSLDALYGCPKLFQEGQTTYQSSLVHTGFNLQYVYTPALKIDHIVRIGPNLSYFELNSQSRTPLGDTSWSLSSLTSNNKTSPTATLSYLTPVPNEEATPWHFTSTITKLSSVFTVHKSKHLYGSIYSNSNYSYQTQGVQYISNSLSWDNEYSKFRVSNAFSWGVSGVYLTNTIDYALRFKTFDISFDLKQTSRQPTPFTFNFIVTKRFPKLGLGINSRNFKLSDVSYSKILSEDLKLDFSQKFESQYSRFQLRQNDFQTIFDFNKTGSHILKNEYINYENDMASIAYTAHESLIDNQIISNSELHFSSTFVFVGNKFNFTKEKINSFAIISPRNNLKGKTIIANDKIKNNIFGNIVLPVNGETAITLSSPDASVWSDLGTQQFLLNPSSFSGYHIPFGGIGTHAIMLILQNTAEAPLANTSVTIKPIKTSVKLQDMSHRIGYGGRLVALGLVLGEYKIDFSDESYGDLYFKIQKDDDNLIRFGLVTVTNDEQTILPKQKTIIEKRQKELLEKLYNSQGNQETNQPKTNLSSETNASAERDSDSDSDSDPNVNADEPLNSNKETIENE
tara:strand:+ start:36712 stop:39138 length:2427 start_codon:yes stop_codon:yes gene_type:complete